MEQIIEIRRRANFVKGLNSRKIGRIVRTPVPTQEKADSFLVLSQNTNFNLNEDIDGYGAILLENHFELFNKDLNSPLISGYINLSDITNNSIVAIEPSGSTTTLFRPESNHNVIFATGLCDNNCLMCSQPPSESDPEEIVDEHLRMIALIKDQPSALLISGGEPTLLGSGLAKILFSLKTKFPDMPLFMLSNGKSFSNQNFAFEIARSIPCNFTCEIPLYADVPALHDYIVQSKGAFEKTLSGLYNCQRQGIPVAIRVVLHKQSLLRLLPLTEFIYRNLPFVRHIALMGLENMGYVKKNWNELWIDPLDYQSELQEAIKHLHYRGMNISIYNHPLCTIPQSLWSFARQSISDFKNIFLNVCADCLVRDKCSGLFASSKQRHSRGIQAINTIN